ncbi:hypothetical protein F5I97DRAFT_2054997 [Phlebopus sp. FC_14]|nr:hypothetical protein F5I97DRAFT_2054997 [Phlebopus sp. FC_14]
MNFLDAYGITGTGSNTPPATGPPAQPSLNEEVSQVIGQFGRFWGGFRKQSEAALAHARKDIGQVVTQAQRELEKLSSTAETPASPSTAADETSSEEEKDESDVDQSADTPTGESASSDPVDEIAATPTSSSWSTQSFFARLQSSLPPNVVSTVQAQLPESLKNAHNVDFSQLRNTLSSEFQRVQGVTRAQAEEYVHKSEAMLREAMKEAGEVLRDAVKVIPPEEQGSGSTAGVVWDGSDIWMLPGMAADAEEGRSSSSYKGKGKETDASTSSRGPSEDSRRAVATRAESLLKQLRSNPEIIKLDPAADSSKESYFAWADASEASGEGFGTKAWSARVAEALSDPVLQDTLETLVPSSMPEEVFWIRYFFRVHQIEAEASKRKALLEGTTENEDDFSWEDDEDEATPSNASQGPHSALASSQHTLAPQKVASVTDVRSLPSSHVQSPVLSPPESSEDSYDVVSGNGSNAGDAQGTVGKKDEEEDDDSDWE